VQISPHESALLGWVRLKVHFVISALISDCIQVFSFLSLLTNIILCELLLCSFRGCFENCGVFAKGGVCSWRVQHHHFGVLCVIKVFDYLVNSQWFLRTGCNFWQIVNQYKHFVWIFLFLHSLNCFWFDFVRWWYKQQIVSGKQLVDFMQSH